MEILGSESHIFLRQDNPNFDRFWRFTAFERICREDSEESLMTLYTKIPKGSGTRKISTDSKWKSSTSVRYDWRSIVR